MELLNAVNDVRAYVHLFCSAMQFKMRYELLVGEVENVVKEENVVEGAKVQSQRTPVFKLGANALHYVPVPSIYHSNLRLKRLKHISLVKCGILIWQQGLPAGEMFVCMEYMGVRDVASVHSAFINVVRNLL